ncbi:MAG: aminotransferase class I/II-fold pyridoxal phosphate-dependent enzyme [Bacteroides sp.]|nr:aminotransferase class I/II-fold pyridoxal phosphate-dependent enzyme [Bacteroides sp.]MCM1413471.1 aminotransferase class I/II-fold pyridoxal phosphate-dependent enzyme [Bacteroides sp.]MCM1471318.1 aminotransferase class I/II-fold pyridoxal phosphate-dependent enzyme [Bacteroides sp.]
MRQYNSQQQTIRPARRVEEVEEYYFSRKLRQVAQMKAEGRDIISLAIGGPDMPPDPEVSTTLCKQALLPTTHSYQPSTGTPAYRKALADFYRRIYNVDLDADTEIQPLIGSKEAVLILSMTFLNPGDKVLIPNPGYPTYTSASRLAGAHILTYALTEQNAWLPDFDQLEQMDLDGVKMMWVNYPNMPTGASADADTFSRLVDFGRRHGILIVNDNPYSMILHPKPTSILQTPGAKDVCIELNSLSKSLNMAGWRMAMMAGKSEYISWVLKVKSNIDSGQFAPMMSAAITALSLPSSWYERLNSVYASRRRVAEKILSALGCSYDPTQGGLFLWARIPDTEGSGEALTERLLHQLGIFITPGFIFGSNGNRYIRISLCANESAMVKALNRILQNNPSL